MCFSVYEQNLLKTNTIGTLIELPKDVISYKDQINDRTLLKPFGYKVMTILTSHDCRFISFRRLLVAKEYMET